MIFRKSSIVSISTMNTVDRVLPLGEHVMEARHVRAMASFATECDYQSSTEFLVKEQAAESWLTWIWRLLGLQASDESMGEISDWTFDSDRIAIN
ncbi:hypothetical protein OGAPHI_000504 [Ogataea philodendri]|uniref:Uncharacterized protein n=1 Tax=Ogataea philodendri TaxID=1378263 RepID=A0A9P8T9X0_9ASCO|nr:uncharacterized protein OGAPHI_000504 [Ogataea philodendri]KAH3671281.1 hypothetical protein OGAPHI_000504 [Ogataea philodendri]